MQKKSTSWMIVDIKDRILGLSHNCPKNYSQNQTIINFSEVKDFDKMISKCPRCGEDIPNSIKQEIKVKKVVNKYAL